MILTIEPGYYEDGQFGCRIENVYVVVKASTEHRFKELKFLTFEPLTLVPIQREMIDVKMLTPKEIDWLNKYHGVCLEKVGALLRSQNRTGSLKWLAEHTTAI